MDSRKVTRQVNVFSGTDGRTCTDTLRFLKPLPLHWATPAERKGFPSNATGYGDAGRTSSWSPLESNQLSLACRASVLPFD